MLQCVLIYSSCFHARSLGYDILALLCSQSDAILLVRYLHTFPFIYIARSHATAFIDDT